MVATRRAASQRVGSIVCLAGTIRRYNDDMMMMMSHMGPFLTTSCNLGHLQRCFLHEIAANHGI